MSARLSVNTGRLVAYIVDLVFHLSIVAIVAIYLAGCTRSGNEVYTRGVDLPPPIDLTARNQAITPEGSTDGTRNSIPQQGGYYEKSDCAPPKPTGWFQ